MASKPIELHADFSQRVLVHGGQLPWQDSPMPGVRRRMLDRIGGEVARATTIVDYAPGSRFSRHVHGGGEEFLILEGVFEDEHGTYPAGAYVRNPPQSAHAPGSTPGCTMLVKLWQFDPADRHPVVLDTHALIAQPDETRDGVSVLALHRDAIEAVRIEVFSPGVTAPIDTSDGAEIFVVAGQCTEGADALVRHSWLRLAPGMRATLRAGDEGARLWIKNGHLAHIGLPDRR